MKKYLEKRLTKLTTKKNELAGKATTTEDINELRAINAQIDEINGDIADINEQLADMRDDTPAEGEGEQRGAIPAGAVQHGYNPISRHVAPAPAATVDATDTPEYRAAFMEYVCRGTAIPADVRATTLTTDATAVIPTTVLNTIIQQMDTYGNIWAKVRKINVKGGVEIPILSIKPTASWITETQSSTDKKIQVNSNITFSYYGLECKVAQTILVNVVSLPMFEQLFSTLVVEAMIRALETAIISGTGSGQPTGITVDSRVPADNVIEMTAADFSSWTKWKKNVFAKMPKAYRNGEFVMAQSTFDSYIDAMVDTTGQPIGRVNYGIAGAETYRFGGKTVETVEPTLIKDFDTAEAGDVVAIFCNFSDYIVNTNMQITTTRWVDNDNNEIKNKALMYVDGKLADPYGVLIIKKKATT
jgi:HK97 family phage major capsid protein